MQHWNKIIWVGLPLALLLTCVCVYNVALCVDTNSIPWVPANTNYYPMQRVGTERKQQCYDNLTDPATGQFYRSVTIISGDFGDEYVGVFTVGHHSNDSCQINSPDSPEYTTLLVPAQEPDGPGPNPGPVPSPDWVIAGGGPGPNALRPQPQCRFSHNGLVIGTGIGVIVLLLLVLTANYKAPQADNDGRWCPRKVDRHCISLTMMACLVAAAFTIRLTARGMCDARRALNSNSQIQFERVECNIQYTNRGLEITTFMVDQYNNTVPIVSVNFHHSYFPFIPAPNSVELNAWHDCYVVAGMPHLPPLSPTTRTAPNAWGEFPECDPAVTHATQVTLNTIGALLTVVFVLAFSAGFVKKADGQIDGSPEASLLDDRDSGC